MELIPIMSPAQERIDNLRRAIRNNRISFPAQTPIFEQSRADIQWRLVLLYFVRGWTCKQLSARYGLTRQRIEQIIAEWVDCAVTHGYLQEIPPLAETAGDRPSPAAQSDGIGTVGAAAGIPAVPCAVYAPASLERLQEQSKESDEVPVLSEA